ncbi:hypothetical protein OPQ81_008376 [Rhizoctonia solani]|nr:hypothetical protein OPQ81_008376 [Rhizoctonia solani]
MIEELNIASGLLSAALERYLDACLSVCPKVLSEGTSSTVSPSELASRVVSEEHFPTVLETKLQEAKLSNIGGSKDPAGLIKAIAPRINSLEVTSLAASDFMEYYHGSTLASFFLRSGNQERQQRSLQIS